MAHTIQPALTHADLAQRSAEQVTLWSHQVALCRDLHAAIKRTSSAIQSRKVRRERGDYPRILVQSPTGSGKSVVMADVVKAALESLNGEPDLSHPLGELCAVSPDPWVVLVVHKHDLMDQMAAHLERAGLGRVATLGGKVSKAELAELSSAPVIIAMVQSFHKIPERDSRPVMVIDEAHHSSSAGFVRAEERLRPCLKVGFSATPIREQGKSLGDQYDELVTGPSYEDGFREQYLMQPHYVLRRADRSVSELREEQRELIARAGRSASGISDADAQAFSLRHVTAVMTDVRDLAAGKPAIVIVANIDTAKAYALTGKKLGLKVEVITSEESPERRGELIAQLSTRQLDALIAVHLLIEGSDIPACQALFIARPMGSLTYWIQVVGRVMRPDGSGERPVVYDYSGTSLLLGRAEHHSPAFWKEEWRTVRKMSKESHSEVATLPRNRQCERCGHTWIGDAVCPSCGAIVNVAPLYNRYLLALERRMARDQERRDRALAKLPNVTMGAQALAEAMAKTMSPGELEILAAQVAVLDWARQDKAGFALSRLKLAWSALEWDEYPQLQFSGVAPLPGWWAADYAARVRLNLKEWLPAWRKELQTSRRLSVNDQLIAMSADEAPENRPMYLSVDGLGPQNPAEMRELLAEALSHAERLKRQADMRQGAVPRPAPAHKPSTRDTEQRRLEQMLERIAPGTQGNRSGAPADTATGSQSLPRSTTRSSTSTTRSYGQPGASWSGKAVRRPLQLRKRRVTDNLNFTAPRSLIPFTLPAEMKYLKRDQKASFYVQLTLFLDANFQSAGTREATTIYQMVFNLSPNFTEEELQRAQTTSVDKWVIGRLSELTRPYAF